MAQAYVKVEKVSAGSSTTSGFQGQYEAVHVSFPVLAPPPDGSGAPAPRPGAARLSRRVDALSPVLVDAYGSGRSLGRVIVTAGLPPPGSGSTRGVELTLEGTKVLEYSAAAADGAGPPTETVLLGATSTSVRNLGSDVRYEL